MIPQTLTSINIWKPAYLARKYKGSPIVSSISSFGHVPYGHSIIGKLELANPHNACESMKFSQHNTHMDGSLIVLTTRGDCPFADKVYNAQKAGAALVIFIDNKQEDINHVLPLEPPEFAHKITIPSVLVSEDVKILFYQKLLGRANFSHLFRESEKSIS